MLVLDQQIVYMPKTYIWNAKQTIQHRIERSQTTKCIQYDIYDTMSCELPNCLSIMFIYVSIPHFRIDVIG